eukprot:4081056-Pyramimonas_sp.AAC.1
MQRLIHVHTTEGVGGVTYLPLREGVGGVTYLLLREGVGGVTYLLLRGDAAADDAAAEVAELQENGAVLRGTHGGRQVLSVDSETLQALLASQSLPAQARHANTGQTSLAR